MRHWTQTRVARIIQLAVLINAFYNTRGGVIVVGVDDQRQPVGLLRPQGVEAGITHILRDRLDLDVLPVIEIVPYQGWEFVVVTCPRGLYPPYLVRGESRPYVRIGSTNRPATHAEMRRLYLLSGETSYESLPCRTAAQADLSPRLVARYRDLRNRHTVGALDLSDEELLRNLGCVVEDEGRLPPPTPACCSSAKTPIASFARTRSPARSSRGPMCCARLIAAICAGRYPNWRWKPSSFSIVTFASATR